MNRKPPKRDLLLACAKLAELVRDEWPGESLADIAARWGSHDPEAAAAVRAVENYWAGG